MRLEEDDSRHYVVGEHLKYKGDDAALIKTEGASGMSEDQ